MICMDVLLHRSATDILAFIAPLSQPNDTNDTKHDTTCQLQQPLLSSLSPMISRTDGDSIKLYHIELQPPLTSEQYQKLLSKVSTMHVYHSYDVCVTYVACYRRLLPY